MDKAPSKPDPLYKRLRKHFDIKLAARANSKARLAPVTVKPDTDDPYVEVPVTMGFEHTQLPIGRLRITKEAARLLKMGMVLSPAYQTEPDERLLEVALIPAANAVPPKDDKPADGRPTGFLWHLFMIGVISGMLAIIWLIIRL